MAEYKGLTLKFGADDSGLYQSLKRLDEGARQTEASLKSIKDALRLDPKSTTLVADAYKVASTNAKSWSREIDTLGKSNERIAKKVGLFKDKMAELETQGGKNGFMYQSLAAGVDDLEEKIGTNNIALDVAKQRLTDAENAQRAWKVQLSAMGTPLHDGGQAMADYGEIVGGVGDKLVTVGTRLSILGTAAAMTLGKTSVQNAEEFGNQISRLGGYLDISGDKLDGMGDLALQWGKETVFSAVESAQAMNELAKGGLTQAEIKAGALEAALSAAAAGGISMADAADVTVQAMRTFGMDASDAASIADALAGAANASTAEISDLSQGFVNVGGVARLAGWDINDTAGALALMADNGYSGAVAGTALKVMLQRLMAPTDKAAAALKELGIDVRDVNGRMKPGTEIVAMFTKATSGLSDEQRDAALQTIFGTRAINAILALMNSGSGTLSKYIGATKQQGYASEMAKNRLGDLGWAIELLKGEAETASVNLGRSLTPTVVKVANAVEGALEKFNSLTDAERASIAQWGLMAVASGPVITAFGGILTVVGKVAKGVGDGTRLISLWGEAVKAGSTGTTALGTAMAALKGDSDNATKYIAKANSAAGAFKATLGLVGVAIAAFIAYKLWEHFENIRKKAEEADKASHSLRDSLNGAEYKSAKDAADGLSGSLGGLAGDYLEVLQNHNKLADKISERMGETKASADELERARDAVKNYGTAARDLSDTELAELELALDALNRECGTNWQWNRDLKQVTDDTGSAVENLTGKVDALIDKRMEEIKLEAYEETLRDLYKQQADEVMLLTEKEKELADAKRIRADLESGDPERIHKYNLAMGQAADTAKSFAGKEKDLQKEIDGVKASIADSEETISRVKELYGESSRKADEYSQAVTDLTMTLDEAARSAGLDELFESGENYDEFIRHLEQAGIKTSDFVKLSSEEQGQLVSAWNDTERRCVNEFAFMTGKLGVMGDEWAKELDRITSETGMSSDDIAAALKSGVESGAISYRDEMPKIIGWLEEYARTNPPEKKLTGDASDVESAADSGKDAVTSYDKTDARKKLFEGTAASVISASSAGRNAIQQHNDKVIFGKTFTGNAKSVIDASASGRDAIQKHNDKTVTGKYFKGDATSVSNASKTGRDAIQKHNDKSVTGKYFNGDATSVSNASKTGRDAIDAFNRKTAPNKAFNASFSSPGYDSVISRINTFKNKSNSNWYGTANFSTYGYNSTMDAIRNFNSTGSGNRQFVATFATRTERAAGGIRTHADGGVRYHAGGSIVNVPKYGYPLDLVGEAGAEAIVPLTNRRYSQPFIDLIANGIVSRMPVQGGVSVNVGTLIVREEADIDRIAAALNTRISRARGGAL